MAKISGITWTDSTFNPWEGCTKIGPGCDNCYAEARNKRFSQGQNWGAGAPRMLRSEKYWSAPLKWERDHEQFFRTHGHRQRVFCASVADVFDNEAPHGQRERLWSLIRATPHLDWLLVTKRIGNASKMLPDDWGCGYANVWLLITVCNQEEADRDIWKLLRIPAAVRGLSIGPMLGAIDLRRIEHPNYNIPADMLSGCDSRAECDSGLLNWVICEGESGVRARPLHPDWVRSLYTQCKAAGTPFHFKQWGEWFGGGTGWVLNQHDPKGVQCNSWGDGSLSMRIGVKNAGRLLDGLLHDGYPESRGSL
ncbi:MAG: phage Gp37/Gp68 family protein [Sideroxydans sp.]|nr:phage Gp37/Gp68 family protein [Sideroxydans sp.]MDD5056670.1 phage Gp37/Gp68 family protein [Sideroxydans sp.]